MLLTGGIMNLLEKYAELAIRTGVNVQAGQTLRINVKAEHYEFARLLVKEAYACGAKKVIVEFNDDIIGKEHAVHQDFDTYVEVPEWLKVKIDSLLEEDLCNLSVYAPSPGLFADVDGEKLATASKNQSEALKAYSDYMMANRGQWSLVSLPTKEWAKTVFPELPVDEAYEKLFEAILYATRVTKDKDPVEAWKEHNATLHHQNKVLNDYNFKSLHFKNSLGTDIVVGLVNDHIWSGGAEVAENGVVFNPNMPTEESFTMPDRTNVNGRVYSTKPLNYQGKLIDEFWLEFKDGAVIDFDAKKEKETLQALLDTDEGSRRIGEIALISHKSPISDLNILFLNTLFDENASCHMALGRAYPMNIKGGLEMTQEELLAHNSNDSLNHEDFMFGSEDMSIIGLTQDDKEVVVFDKGNFVI